MILETVALCLTVIATLVCVIVLGLNILQIWQKWRAEQEYLQLLRKNHAITLGELRTRAMDDGVVSAKELAQIIEALEQAACELSSTDRQLVASGFRQRSMLGRARYAARLMNKAGIGSGPLPIPVA